MFPGLNYLYLPLVAPILETACKEFDVKFHKIHGYSGFHEFLNNYLKKYSQPTKKKKSG
eukprot:TRINITY_DN6817_c0_g1_i1.p1 TRINITY_DN6817_c0_g1~~TRINITY_DN6817_c0_g1_i1.p1  ORF type:complete len:59 (+),score=9.00 TRINITY_DN6817_c0_g1_i1:292-468(+)